MTDGVKKQNFSLLIDVGCAVTRGVLMKGNIVYGFFFAPARGDEEVSARPFLGDVYLGIVRRAAPALKGAFVDLGEGGSGLLVDRKKKLVEGARVIAAVKREAIDGKEPVLTPDWRARTANAGGGDQQQLEERVEKALSQKAPPGRLSRRFDPAIDILRQAAPFGPTTVTVSDIESKRVLTNVHDGPLTVARNPFEETQVDDVLAQSIEETLTLKDGERIIFAETPAVIAVDIDTGSMGGASKQANDVVNQRVAQRLPLEILRRRLGGRVVVDFPPPTNAEARSALMTQLKKGLAMIAGVRVGRLAPDGLFDFTAPRLGPSLLEMASEWDDTSLLRPGRRLRSAWRAAEAVTQLERRLRQSDRVRLTLIVGGAVNDELAETPKWLDRLRTRYGARFEVILDESLGTADFSVVEQP